MKLWLDRETFGEDDLTEVGAYKYAETAEDILVSYAIDDGPVKDWDVTAEPIPADLRHAMEHAEEVWAHNATFDRAVQDGPKQSHLPHIDLRRWRCSMAMALSHALPASLADLGMALNLPAELQKLDTGKKLINLFCKPQPSNRKLRRCTRLTHPVEWEKFRQYARNDIAAMRESVRQMPVFNWDAACIEEYHHDQEINQRGFYADLELTAAGQRASETEKVRIHAQVAQILGCSIRVSQRDKFRDLLNERYGLDLEDTKKDTFLHVLKNSNLHPECAALLNLALQANKTSTAKYAKLHPAIQHDRRFRGGLQFCGASRTRRLAGRMFQAQNLPSRGLPKADKVELYIDTLKEDAHHLFFEDKELMWYGAAALRGVIIAPPGKKLVACDLSNIEGRMLAWVSGEQWKLDAFRAYDAGTGPDLYNITAVNIIGGDPWKVEKHNRNAFGKVPDLASGYMGGVSGYQTFAKAYNTRMADHWGTIQKQIAPAHISKARDNLEKFGRRQMDEMQISEIEWLASETCKVAWRARHPATVAFWYALQDAAMNAINEWGKTFRAGKLVKVKCVTVNGHRWLIVRLPSGRYLTYYDPKLLPGSFGRKQITYMGDAAEKAGDKRGWIRVYTHGGKMTGNVCQSTARDILVPALQKAETMGYLPVISVHDEGVCEVPDHPSFSVEGLSALLTEERDWTKGLPLAASGFEGPRYKKED